MKTAILIFIGIIAALAIAFSGLTFRCVAPEGKIADQSIL